MKLIFVTGIIIISDADMSDHPFAKNKTRRKFPHSIDFLRYFDFYKGVLSVKIKTTNGCLSAVWE
jgi:hypothetical protein